MISEISNRLERAQRSDNNFHIAETEPFVIQVESSSGDDEYTVVPNVAFCNCPDKMYRSYPCYHLLYLALHDDISTELRESFVSGFQRQAEDWIGYVEEDDQTDRETIQIRDAWLDAHDLLEANQRVENVKRTLTEDSSSPNAWTEKEVKSWLENVEVGDPSKKDSRNGPSLQEMADVSINESVKESVSPDDGPDEEVFIPTIFTEEPNVDPDDLPDTGGSDTTRAPEHSGYVPGATVFDPKTDNTESETDEIARIASTAQTEE